MPAPFLFRGDRRKRLHLHTRLRQRGVTLLELIIVLFIIGLMASLMFPAIQSARAKADSTACLNNVRQVGFALEQATQVMKTFPQPNRWTIDCLRWMEERPLYDQIMTNGIPKGAEYPRPKLFRCVAQSEFSSKVPNVGICHYVLVVDRPIRPDNKGRVRWELNDRPILSDNEPLDPWYLGPEMSFSQQQNMLATMKGPHPSGTYYSNTGATLGGN
jgi:prepilin-type N-terminal cleavage/methylation domain-containing protein